MKLIFVIKEFGSRLSRMGSLLGEGVSAYASLIPFAGPVIHAAAAGDQDSVPLLPELAAEHVREIRREGVAEPCIVVGYCAEGLLAYEVARQLEGSGIPVEAVFLLDTMMFPSRSGWRSRLFWRWVWVRDNLRFTLEGGSGYVRTKFQGARLKRRLRRAPGTAPLPAPMLQNDDMVADMVRAALLGDIFRHARRHYHPQPLDCRGVIFRSQDFPEPGAEHDRKIERLFRGGVEFVRVAGGHSTVLCDLKSLVRHFERHLAIREPAGRAMIAGVI